MFNQLMVIPNAIALFALSGAVLVIANAKHDMKATDVHEEKLEDEERAALNAMAEAAEKLDEVEEALAQEELDKRS